ncbi:hypothetical protein QQ045_006847 [Rhodiola kirilowii]
MKKGEKVLLTVKPQYGFGENGKPASGNVGTIPPNAILQIELELVSWKTVTEVTDDKKVLKKTLKEGEGYERPNDGAVVRSLKVSCNLNNAACKLKLKEYKEAEKLCTKVLELESTNVKALYRRAQAYINLGDLDVAEFDVKKALELDPENRDVKMEYKVLKEKMREYNKKQAKFYGNMFAKLTKPDAMENKAAA